MTRTVLRNHDYEAKRVTARELRRWMSEVHELLDRLVTEVIVLDLNHNQMNERFTDLREWLEERLKEHGR